MGEVWQYRAAERVVLGLRLQPLTLGHVFLLREVGSPFVTDQVSPPSPSDLLVAVFICASPARVSRRNMRAWWFGFFIWVWLWRLRVWPVKDDPFAGFEEYLREGREGPRLKQRLQVEVREFTTPDHWRLYVRLRKELGMGHEEAEDVPVFTARCMDVTLADLEDRGEVETERDRALWEHAAAEDAKKFAQEKTEGTEKTGPHKCGTPTSGPADDGIGGAK